jgi:hypothetical protein
MTQPLSSDRALRGAMAMRDYINSRLGGGPRVSRPAVYRMIETGKIPVTRLADKGEVWSTTGRIDEALGLSPDTPTESVDADPRQDAA